MIIEFPAVLRQDRGLTEISFRLTDVMKQIEAKDFFSFFDEKTSGYYSVRVSKPRKPRTTKTHRIIILTGIFSRSLLKPASPSKT